MKRNANVIFILCSMIFFLSCKREEFEPYFGPQACPDVNFQIVTNFEINKEFPAVVNFTTTESLNLSAQFNSPAPWKIEITGESSHAVKIYEGFTDQINLAWYGRPSGELFFSNEKVIVKFSIRCKDELTVIRYVNIIKTDFTKDPNVVIVNDFDGHPLVSAWDYYLVSDPIFPTAKGDTAICPNTSKVGFCNSYVASPQGGNSLSFIGTAPVSGGDQKNIYASYEVYPPSLNKPAISTDPNLLWFNFFANSGTTNPVKVIVSFRHWNGTTRFGKKVILINSPKWNMYSINLGQLEVGVEDETTFNAKDVGLIIFTIVQQEATTPTEFNIDMANFTAGESFLGLQ